jgi:hypothetical protein
VVFYGSSLEGASGSHTRWVGTFEFSRRPLLLPWVSPHWYPSKHSCPGLFMLEEECPPQSPFLGKRRTVDIARAPKEDTLQQLKVGDILFLQLSKSCPCWLSFPWILLSDFLQMTFGTGKKERRKIHKLDFIEIKSLSVIFSLASTWCVTHWWKKERKEGRREGKEERIGERPWMEENAIIQE